MSSIQSSAFRRKRRSKEKQQPVQRHRYLESVESGVVWQGWSSAAGVWERRWVSGLIHHPTKSEPHPVNNRGPLRCFKPGYAMSWFTVSEDPFTYRGNRSRSSVQWEAWNQLANYFYVIGREINTECEASQSRASGYEGLRLRHRTEVQKKN